jgi:hypothetical protein
MKGNEMSNEKQSKTAGTPVSQDDVAQVGGGDGDTCSASVSVGGVVSQGAPTVGEAGTTMYDGLVDTTSHIIERVVNSMK